MQHKKLKYILDIESIISEIEFVKSKVNSFEEFNQDIITKRAIERHLEIIGEALNQLKKIDPAIHITGLDQIISLRNLIIHAYDTVDSSIIWPIIQKDIPLLKEDIKRIKE